MTLQSAQPILIGLFALLALAVFKKLTSTNKKYTISDYDKSILKTYSLSQSILTGPELIFYRVLRKHMNDKFIIGTKIRLADFIGLRKQARGKGPTSTQSAFNRISRKHADFVICSLKGKPLVWIELDDKSHNTKSAKKADKFKNEVASAIGIPLVRILTGSDYNQAVSQLKSDLY